MKNTRLLAILNSLGFVLVIVMNTLANVLPINGLNTGQLSDFYPNLFVPAGFTFSIWGVIYLALLVFVVYSLVQAFNNKGNDGFLLKIGPWFIVSCLANAAWILAWHYMYVGLSVLIMLTLLISLIAMYLRLGIGKQGTLSRDRYLVHLPFSLYLGWITIATVANFTTLLVTTGWGGWGLSEEVWTALMIVVAAFISMTVLLSRADVFYSAVTLWAFYGIIAKRQMQAEPEQLIVYTLITGMFLVVAVGVMQVIREGIYYTRNRPI